MVSLNTQRLRSRALRYEGEVLQFACPISGVALHPHAGQRHIDISPLGSGFLLRLSSYTILVTAAHVLDLRFAYQLQIPGATRFVPLRGMFYSTGPEEPVEAPSFGFDLGFVVLDTAQMLEPPSTPTLDANAMDPSDFPAQRIAYGFVGYPLTQNRPEKGYFRRNVLFLGGVSPRQGYSATKLSPREYVLLTFDRKHMLGEDGADSTSVVPTGISGGPIFKLGSYDDIESGVAHPRVVGVATDWRNEYKLLQGTRIALLIELLRTVLPDTYAELPSPVHIKAKVTEA